MHDYNYRPIISYNYVACMTIITSLTSLSGNTNLILIITTKLTMRHKFRDVV